MAIEFVKSDGTRPTAIRTITFRSKAPKKLTAFYYALGLQVSSQKTDAGEVYMAKCNGALFRFVAHPKPPPEEVVEFGFIVDDLEQALIALQAQAGQVIGEPRTVRGRQCVKVADPDGRRLNLFEAAPTTNGAVERITERVDRDQQRDEIEAISDGAGVIVRGVWLLFGVAFAIVAFAVAAAWLDLPNETAGWILLGLMCCTIPCEILIIVGKFRCLGDSGNAKGWLYTSVAFDVIGLVALLPGLPIASLCRFATMLTFLFFVRSVAKNWPDPRTKRFAEMLLATLGICLFLVMVSVVGTQATRGSLPSQQAGVILLAFTSVLLLGSYVGYLVFLHRLRDLEVD